MCLGAMKKRGPCLLRCSHDSSALIANRDWAHVIRDGDVSDLCPFEKKHVDDAGLGWISKWQDQTGH